MISLRKGRLATAAVFGLCTLTVATDLAQSGPTPQYIALEEVSRIPRVERYAVADFDLDGIDEVITLSSDRRGVLLWDADHGIFRPVWHLPIFKGEFRGVDAHDIVGDRAPEVFVSVKMGDTAWVQVYDANRELLKETEPVTGVDQRGDGTWDGFIDKFNIIDVDRDGQKDILASVLTGYDRLPRGVYAYGWETGNLLWHFPTACHIIRIMIDDLYGNGTEEIILSTSAPSNGYEINGMDDAHSYIIALDRRGNLLWKQVTSGIFFAPYIETEDLDRDGRTEVINTFASGDVDDPNTKFELQVRDGQTGSVKKYFPLTYTGGFILGDLNRDGAKEIIAGGHDGTLMVFNKDLDLLHRFKRG
ncbi:MAG: hypothetical protein ACE5OR_10125, partial [bacterium]